MENEIGTIKNKEKGNETLCRRGDILTVLGIGLIQFLESCYTRNCSSMASVGIDENIFVSLTSPVCCLQSEHDIIILPFQHWLLVVNAHFRTYSWQSNAIVRFHIIFIL